MTSDSKLEDRLHSRALASYDPDELLLEAAEALASLTRKYDEARIEIKRRDALLVEMADQIGEQAARALAAEADAARLKEADKRWGRLHQQVIEERAAEIRAREAAEAKAERLEKALKPFAAVAAPYMNGGIWSATHDDYPDWAEETSFGRITLGELREAARALSQEVKP